MDVRTALATKDQREVVGRLLEFNAYEFSGIDDRSIGEDARYGYLYLDAYWTEPDRFPYLIWADDELAGLALLRTLQEELTVAEFLVLPKFRRRSVGTRAARALFELRPGRWRITEVPGNSAATAFWRRAIPVRFEERELGDGTVIQTFTMT